MVPVGKVQLIADHEGQEGWKPVGMQNRPSFLGLTLWMGVSAQQTLEMSVIPVIFPDRQPSPG